MEQINHNITKIRFTHLTYTERTQIERWYNMDGRTKTDIATLLNKSVRTIRREINNNLVKNLNTDLTERLVYSAAVSQERYDYNMTGKGPNMILDGSIKICKHIEFLITKEKYSPEVVSLKLKEEGLCNVSGKTIRNTIAKEGFFKKLKPGKIIYRKQYKSANPRKAICDKVPAEKSIEHRPQEANDRSVYGHWEGDLVIGTRKRGKALFTLTERKTRDEIIILINDKKCSSVAAALDKLEKKYKDDFSNIFKTITFDNGAEFRNYALLEKSVYSVNKRTELYYAHPYCSGERGTNENANRLIRRWIPKGKSMNHLTHKFVQEIQDWINDYPREMFGYLSSNQYKEFVLNT